MPRRAVRHLGRRGAALLAFAAVDTFYGVWLYGLDRQASPGIYDWFSEIIPMRAWGSLWLSVAMVIFAHAVVGRRGSDWVGFAAAISIEVIWGLLSLVGCIAGNVPVSTVGIWLGFAAFVGLIAGWPEPPIRGDDQV